MWVYKFHLKSLWFAPQTTGKKHVGPNLKITGVSSSAVCSLALQQLSFNPRSKNGPQLSSLNPFKAFTPNLRPIGSTPKDA